MVHLLALRDACASVGGTAVMAVGGLGGLSGLCSSGGWTYGALWRFDCWDQWLLVLEESYHVEQRANILGKLINQVHVIGQGTIGEVAISGKHRWINFDFNWMESSETSTSVNLDMLQGGGEWQHQILAGIKTIAVISMPPLGVIQFGSTQKISESSHFIARAHYLLRKLGTKQHGDAHIDLKFSLSQARFASVSSQDANYFKSNISSHDGVCNQTKDNHLSLEWSSLASGLLSLGSQIGTRSEAIIQKPHVSSIPVVSTSSVFSYGLSYPYYGIPSFSRTTSCQVTKQQAVLAEHQTLLPPNNGELHSNVTCPSNPFTGYLTSNDTWYKMNDSLSVMEHKLSHGMALPGVFRMTPTSHSSIPRMDVSHFLCKNLAISHSKGVSQAVDRSSISSNSELSLSVAEKLLGLQHCSSLPVSKCSFSRSKYSSKGPLFNLELPESFPTSQGLNLDSSILSDTNKVHHRNYHIHDKAMNNQIHSCEKTNYELSNSNAVPILYDFSDVRSSCSAMDGTVYVACTEGVTLPNNLTESVAECVATSLNRCGNWTESTSDSTAQLVSDNDLMFDGMELDLSPMILRHECWNDIALPVACNSYMDLSTNFLDSISEIEMGTIAGSGKELFSDSSFQQLLDDVVAGNASLSTSCNSVRTTVNSSASQDSSHHSPTFTKPRDAQINHIPVIGLSSRIQKRAVSLPECDKENVMQGSSEDAHPTSHVRTWISDSCSVNDRGSAPNQSKKPEESAKVVRKRARPGESTRLRPKDRQQIQDRVKELREIVPNGEKCSIDALLDHTIKHMLFLQSVTKYADKLKQADELMRIGEESGVVLKDHTNEGVGGATWAYEVAGQTMVCPILVEDVHPSGQMHVEMLCEERVFFLEIADVVRGFGLTILKGVMENHERKVWARFLVEANRDVSRMDLFLSLVQFMQQTSKQ